jgi:hypothetical protein
MRITLVPLFLALFANIILTAESSSESELNPSSLVETGSESVNNGVLNLQSTAAAPVNPTLVTPTVDSVQATKDAIKAGK